MKTTVINLYGGPGCGKSTIAAGLFYEMKRRDLSCELAREYVKDWAWEGRTPSIYDQAHFFGEQSRRESILYGKVRFVITDSPLLLSTLYDKHNITSNAVEMFMRLATKIHGVRYMHFVLKRTKEYNPHGRFHSEEEAKEIDQQVKDLLLLRATPFGLVNIPDDQKVAHILGRVLSEEKA